MTGGYLNSTFGCVSVIFYRIIFLNISYVQNVLLDFCSIIVFIGTKNLLRLMTFRKN